MPWPVFLVVVALFALYIVCDAAFDVSRKIANLMKRRKSKPAPPPPRVSARDTDAMIRTSLEQPAIQRREQRNGLWALAGVALVLIGIVFVANRFTTSPGQVRAEFREDVAQSESSTHAAETTLAQKTIVRVEAHARDMARLEGELADVRDAIADAPDLDVRAAASVDFVERMRVEAEAARAAALRSLDPGLLS